MPNPIALIFKSYPKRIGDLWSFTFAVILNGDCFWQFKSRLLLFVFVTTGDIFLGYPFFISLACTFLALASVGLFPVNVYHLHVLGLKWFFYLGSLSAIFYLALVFSASLILVAGLGC